MINILSARSFLIGSAESLVAQIDQTRSAIKRGIENLKAAEAKKAELEAKKKRAAALKVLQKWRRTGSIK